MTAGELFDRILSFYRGHWTDTARTKLEPLVRGFVLVNVERALPLISPSYDDGIDEIRNSTTASITVELSFHADNGTSLVLPLIATQQGKAQMVSASALVAVISPKARKSILGRPTAMAHPQN